MQRESNSTGNSDYHYTRITALFYMINNIENIQYTCIVHAEYVNILPYTVPMYQQKHSYTQ